MGGGSYQGACCLVPIGCCLRVDCIVIKRREGSTVVLLGLFPSLSTARARSCPRKLGIALKIFLKVQFSRGQRNYFGHAASVGAS